MVAVFSSNTPYGGSIPLPTLAQIAYTPAELFDAFEARVIADGGEIISEAATLEAITYLQSARLYGRLSVCASPRWGVKKSSGRYAKWYSLDGSDMIGEAHGTGDLPLAGTDANGHPVATVGVDGSRNGGTMKSENLIKIVYAADQWGGIHACQTDSGGLTMVTALDNGQNASAGLALCTLGRNSTQTNWTAQLAAYNPDADSDLTKRINDSGARGVTDRVGTAVILKVSTGQVSLLNSGTVINSYDVAADGLLFAYQTVEKRLRVGTLYDSSANLTASRGGLVSDLIVPTYATDAEHKALSAKISEWALAD